MLVRRKHILEYNFVPCSYQEKKENVLNILVSFLTRVQFTIPFYTENIETKDDISHKVKLIKQMDR